MENWNAIRDKTDKICKFFLDSVEAGKYGWRWICPNGNGCIYRHALPQGYSLKRDQGQEKKGDTILEEQLEIERAQIQGGTPITLERFLKWKEEKRIKREKESEQKRVDEAKKSGKGSNALSGRALFTYDPTLFQDDAEALGNEEYEEEERVEEEEEKKEEDDDEFEEGDAEDEEDAAEEEENDIPDNNGVADDEDQIQIPDGQSKDEGQAEEAKKKKKKNKKKKQEDEDDNVQINEDVFLGEEDVELPDDYL